MTGQTAMPRLPGVYPMGYDIQYLEKLYACDYLAYTTREDCWFDS